MIRAAEPRDGEAVARLHQRAWLRAYADFLDVERVLAWDMRERAAVWSVRARSREVPVWVFEVDGRIAGVASAGPAPEDGPGAGVLYALYVEPAAQGAGVGSALLAHAEQALAAADCEQALLWVFERNGHGRRFYEARGWTLVEGSRAPDPNWGIASVRYRKELAR